ncbi:MAG: hypothetical protein HFI93_07160 [Lachnospiraceae bacterium]|nr:hypothetical protein [Lachnospiraceae bacterium]
MEIKREKLRTQLYHLGVNESYSGFGWVMDAAFMVSRDESLKTCMKIVYIDVAKKNKTAEENVRRDITTLIRVIWKSGNKKLLKELAGKDLEKPPRCQEFIWILADYIRREERLPKPAESHKEDGDKT